MTTQKIKKMFDIDEFINMWNAGKLLPYFEKLQASSTNKLREFKCEVKAHKKKQSRVVTAFYDYPRKYSIHDALIDAINWELIKRSKFRFSIHRKTIPLRRWWTSFWNGLDLIEHEQIGVVYKRRNYTKSKFSYLGLKNFLVESALLPTLRYIGKNLYWIIPSIVAIVTALIIVFWGK